MNYKVSTATMKRIDSGIKQFVQTQNSLKANSLQLFHNYSEINANLFKLSQSIETDDFNSNLQVFLDSNSTFRQAFDYSNGCWKFLLRLLPKYDLNRKKEILKTLHRQFNDRTKFINKRIDKLETQITSYITNKLEKNVKMKPIIPVVRFSQDGILPINYNELILTLNQYVFDDLTNHNYERKVIELLNKVEMRRHNMLEELDYFLTFSNYIENMQDYNNPLEYEIDDLP